MVVDWLPGSTVHMMDTAFSVSLLASYHSSHVCGLVGKPEVSRNPICRCYPLLFCSCCCCWKMGLPPFPWTLPICVVGWPVSPQKCLSLLPSIGSFTWVLRIGMRSSCSDYNRFLTTLSPQPLSYFLKCCNLLNFRIQFLIVLKAKENA